MSDVPEPDQPDEEPEENNKPEPEADPAEAG